MQVIFACCGVMAVLLYTLYVGADRGAQAVGIPAVSVEAESMPEAKANAPDERPGQATVQEPHPLEHLPDRLTVSLTSEVTGEVNLWAANETRRDWFAFGEELGLVRGVGPKLGAPFLARDKDTLVINGRWHDDRGRDRWLVEPRATYIVSVYYGGRKLSCRKTFPKDAFRDEYESLFPDLYCKVE